MLMFAAEHPEGTASSLMLYSFAEGDSEILSYTPGHCTGLLSKYKHYMFQGKDPL